MLCDSKIKEAIIRDITLEQNDEAKAKATDEIVAHKEGVPVGFVECVGISWVASYRFIAWSCLLFYAVGKYRDFTPVRNPKTNSERLQSIHDLTVFK